MLAKSRAESINNEGVVAISSLGVLIEFLVWFGQVAKLRGEKKAKFTPTSAIEGG